MTVSISMQASQRVVELEERIESAAAPEMTPEPAIADSPRWRTKDLLDTDIGSGGKDVRFLLQGVVLADVPNPAQLIAGVTTLLAEILGKNPHTTVVIIDEVETDNWGIGGESVTVRRTPPQRTTQTG